MSLLKYIEVDKVDKLMVLMSKLVYGDMTKYGLTRPKEGPFALKIKGGRTPTIDVGCVSRIKKGKVKVNKDNELACLNWWWMQSQKHTNS